MTDEEHIKANHYKDSTNAWVDPKDYIDVFYADW